MVETQLIIVSPLPVRGEIGDGYAVRLVSSCHRTEGGDGVLTPNY